jgi:putative membrane protein
MGALYGVLLEVGPDSLREGHPSLTGLGYGSALFVGADELAVPALGLSGSAKEAPLSAHIYGLASHLVYGLTGEAVRRTVRNYL